MMMKMLVVSSVSRSALKQTVVLLVIAILFNLVSYDVLLLLGHIARLYRLRRIVRLNHVWLQHVVDVTILLMQSLLAVAVGHAI